MSWFSGKAAAKKKQDTQAKTGLFSRLKAGLGKSRAALSSGLSFLARAERLDEALLEQLEETLIQADMGVDLSLMVVEDLRQAVKAEGLQPAQCTAWLGQRLQTALHTGDPMQVLNASGLTVIMLAGVNGAGKTTTAGKLAARYQQAGHRCMLAACDTFRAAAIEQLKDWGARLDVPVIAGEHGADPAAVAFDAVQSAQSRGMDVLLVDTAGRLHTQDHLMRELAKMKRVLGKANAAYPQATWLVLDAATGSNAKSQARLFSEHIQLDGLIMSKLDGTAKGGAVLALSHELALPVMAMGVGEGVDDLQTVDAASFVRVLLGLPDKSGESLSAVPR